MRGAVMGVRMLAIWGLPLGLVAAGPLIERAGYAPTVLLYCGLGSPRPWRSATAGAPRSGTDPPPQTWPSRQIFRIHHRPGIARPAAGLMPALQWPYENHSDVPPDRGLAARAVFRPGLPAEPVHGLLLKARGESSPQPAPLLETEVEIRVTGHVARAKVTQRFLNPHRDWYEGVYVFPLPENAAVDRLRMRIGERIVEGEVQEKAQARQTYAEAKSEGRRAALLEQERPNIFTSSVANIAPGEEVRVEIEYQQTLRYDQGRYSLRFPMVVGPRYLPASMDPVDAARISPAVLRPDESAQIHNPVRLRVEVQAGVPLAALRSPSHAIDTESCGGALCRALLRGPVPANKDFVLDWGLAAGPARPRPRSPSRRTAALRPRHGRAAGARAARPGDSARGDLRHRHFGLDAGNVDRRRRRKRSSWRSAAFPPATASNVIEFNSYAQRLYGTRGRTTPETSSARCAGCAGCAPRGAPKWRVRSTSRWTARDAGLASARSCSSPTARSATRTTAGHDPRAARRFAPVHRRHRLGAEQPLHDQGGAVRRRHLHLYRPHRRGEGEDGCAVRQAGIADAEGRAHRLGRRRRRRSLAAAGSRPLQRRAGARAVLGGAARPASSPSRGSPATRSGRPGPGGAGAGRKRAFGALGAGAHRRAHGPAARRACPRRKSATRC
jgi:hypothetical protein